MGGRVGRPAMDKIFSLTKEADRRQTRARCRGEQPIPLSDAASISARVPPVTAQHVVKN